MRGLSRLFICVSLLLLGITWFASAQSEPAVTLNGQGQHVIPADPDSEDDTARLRKIIETTSGALRFGSGTFRISQPLTIDLNKRGFTSVEGDGTTRIVMTGPGPAFHWTGTHGGTAAPHTVKDEVWDRQRMPIMDGLEIIGTHPEADGIEVEGTMQLTLTRLVIRKTRHAIHLVNRNRNVLIAECHLYENSGAGVFMDQLNLHQVNINNCHISYNRQGGVVLKKSEIRNLQIGTCDIEGNMGEPDDPPAANVEIDGRGSSIGEVAIVGCTIQHDHNAKGSANIRINGTGNPLRYTDEIRHGHITIADNILSDVQTNIELENCRAVTVTGNTLWKGYTHDLHIINCKDCVIASNVFDRNPRYGYSDSNDAEQGILIESSQDSILNGNLIAGTRHRTAALHLKDCSRFKISDCSLLEYGQTGLLMENCKRCLVSDCFIDQEKGPENAPNLRLENCENIQLQDNFLSDQE